MISDFVFCASVWRESEKLNWISKVILSHSSTTRKFISSKIDRIIRFHVVNKIVKCPLSLHGNLRTTLSMFYFTESLLLFFHISISAAECFCVPISTQLLIFRSHTETFWHSTWPHKYSECSDCLTLCGDVTNRDLRFYNPLDSLSLSTRLNHMPEISKYAPVFGLCVLCNYCAVVMLASEQINPETKLHLFHFILSPRSRTQQISFTQIFTTYSLCSCTCMSRSLIKVSSQLSRLWCLSQRPQGYQHLSSSPKSF